MPRSPVYDVPDGCVRDAIASAKLALRDTARCGDAPNLDYLRVGKARGVDGRPMPGIAAITPLTHLVVYIVLHGSWRQVHEIAARWIVARPMAQDYAGGQRAVRQFPREAVCELAGARPTHAAIAIRVAFSHPGPASVGATGAVHSRPERFRRVPLSGAGATIAAITAAITAASQFPAWAQEWLAAQTADARQKVSRKAGIIKVHALLQSTCAMARGVRSTAALLPFYHLVPA